MYRANPLKVLSLPPSRPGAPIGQALPVFPFVTGNHIGGARLSVRGVLARVLASALASTALRADSRFPCWLTLLGFALPILGSSCGLGRQYRWVAVQRAVSESVDGDHLVWAFVHPASRPRSGRRRRSVPG